MKLLIDEAWVKRMAELEEGQEIGAGSPMVIRDLWLQTLAERFCAMTLPDSVASDLCATQPGPNRHGTNLLTVAEAKEMLGKLI